MENKNYQGRYHGFFTEDYIIAQELYTPLITMAKNAAFLKDKLFELITDAFGYWDDCHSFKDWDDCWRYRTARLITRFTSLIDALEPIELHKQKTFRLCENPSINKRGDC